MKIKKDLLKRRLPLLHVQSRLISVCFVILTNHSYSWNLGGQTCETIGLDDTSGSQSVVPGTNTASVSAEKQKNMQISRRHYRPTAAESLGGLQHLCFKEPSRWFWGSHVRATGLENINIRPWPCHLGSTMICGGWMIGKEQETVLTVGGKAGFNHERFREWMWSSEESHLAYLMTTDPTGRKSWEGLSGHLERRQWQYGSVLSWCVGKGGGRR